MALLISANNAINCSLSITLIIFSLNTLLMLDCIVPTAKIGHEAVAGLVGNGIWINYIL